MKYIVNNKEVSKDTFYFCKRAKEENKTLVLLNPNNDVPADLLKIQAVVSICFALLLIYSLINSPK